MRWLIGLILTISLGVGLAILMRFNHGNVAILWPPYRVDVSVNFAVLVLLLCFFLLHFVLIATGKALDLPSRVRVYRMRQRSGAARIALRDSLLAFLEGRFGRAERLAQAAREDEELAGAAALLAARAAHQMHESERRNRWMELAEGERNSAHAESMVAAEFALDDEEPGQALLALEKFQGASSRHIHSLRVALRAHEQLGDWNAVLHILRHLEKREALSPSEIRSLRIRACSGLFAHLGADAGVVRDVWRGLKSAERDLTETHEAASAAFLRAGDQQQARKLIETALDREFSVALLRSYTALDEVPARERIEHAERWLEKYGDEGALLMTLGRLCMSAQIWGKAEEFMRRSLQRGASVNAHLAMAELLEVLERPQDAATHYRAAALLRA